jgi:hypothetical protein
MCNLSVRAKLLPISPAVQHRHFFRTTLGLPEEVYVFIALILYKMSLKIVDGIYNEAVEKVQSLQIHLF